jgi:hypothetical protein
VIKNVVAPKVSHKSTCTATTRTTALSSAEEQTVQITTNSKQA